MKKFEINFKLIFNSCRSIRNVKQIAIAMEIKDILGGVGVVKQTITTPIINVTDVNMTRPRTHKTGRGNEKKNLAHTLTD